MLKVFTEIWILKEMTEIWTLKKCTKLFIFKRFVKDCQRIPSLVKIEQHEEAIYLETASISDQIWTVTRKIFIEANTVITRICKDK